MGGGGGGQRESQFSSGNAACRGTERRTSNEEKVEEAEGRSFHGHPIRSHVFVDDGENESQ